MAVRAACSTAVNAGPRLFGPLAGQMPGDP